MRTKGLKAKTVPYRGFLFLFEISAIADRLFKKNSCSFKYNNLKVSLNLVAQLRTTVSLKTNNRV